MLHDEQTRREVGFNPRLPGGRRPFGTGRGTDVVAVSIHAFRGEGDASKARLPPHEKSFNPRLPGGRRRDLRPAIGRIRSFNPRLPGGRRRSDNATQTGVR